MENFGHKKISVERIVGTASSEDKESLHKSLEKASVEQNIDSSNELYRQHEVEKTEDQEVLFELALKNVNQLRIQYGGTPLNWTKDNLHVFRSFQIKSKPGESEYIDHDGVFLTTEQQIWITQSDLSNLGDIKKMTHELLHVAGYNALQLDYFPDNDVNMVQMYRNGLFIQERTDQEIHSGNKKPQEFFRNWNEAVIEDLTKQLLKKYKHPLLERDQYERREAIRETFESQRNTRTKEELEDLAFIEGDVMPFGFNYVRHSYARPRQIYAMLYEKIYLANKNQFKNAGEIKDLTIRAMLTGNILPLGKLIDKTFSKGIFRLIGESDANIDKLDKVINELVPANTS